MYRLWPKVKGQSSGISDANVSSGESYLYFKGSNVLFSSVGLLHGVTGRRNSDQQDGLEDKICFGLLTVRVFLVKNGDKTFFFARSNDCFLFFQMDMNAK